MMRGFALLAVCSLTMLLVGCGASATSSDKPADATPPTSTSKASAASPGETYYWGENIRGREYSAMPSTPYAIYPLNSPSSTGALAVQVAAGGSTACEVVTGNGAGDVYCMGSNNEGETGTKIFPDAPAEAAFKVYSGAASVVVSGGDGTNHTCALDNSGALTCWGNIDFAQGDTDTAQSEPTPISVGGLRFKQISTSDATMCGIATTGVSYCWGANDHGQVGNGSQGSAVPTPTEVVGSHDFVQIAAGNNVSCGINGVGRAFCWGSNDEGELGNGTSSSRSTPIAVAGGHTFRQISVGQSTVCGIDASGHAYCWGSSRYGDDAASALGNGAAGNANTPQQVSGGHHFVQISVGESERPFACAVDSGGAAYCWGANESGQLGTGSTTPSEVPILVSGLAGHKVSQVAAGFAFVVAIVS